jgi:predicted ATPase/DNA-binding SARP family transcriptional activator
MARLAILSLGALHITLDDTPLTAFDSDKARALLAYLAIESHREHRREHLAGLFWSEYPEDRARHTLSQVVSNVRQIIGDRLAGQTTPFLDVTRQTLSFNRASDYWLDVDLFTALPRLDTHQTLGCCEQAIAVYRGHFLEGLSIGDSPAFEEWLLMQRERWQRKAVETLGRLIEGHTHLRDYDKALHYVWQQLDLDPWREDAHRQAMRLLALSRQRTAALTQYEVCCHMLRQALGAEPEAETVALYEAIKVGVWRSREAKQTTPPLRHSPPHNLPAHLTPLIGREAELASVRAHLHAPECRLLTLVGPGGIGKTRLALEVAAPLVPHFAHGVFFVPLTALHVASAVVPTLAQSIGFTFADKGGTQEEQLLAYLNNKALLLILDNVEHLLRTSPASPNVPRDVDITVTDVIVNILEAAPDVKMMATSRTSLAILGEYLFPVRGLAYPDKPDGSPADVQHLAAVQLFVHSARRQRPDFALTAHNVEAVSTICRYVQGVPLAILLIAGWTSTLSTAEIASRLTGDAAAGPGRGLDLLETDWHNVPLRHRSLRAVFEHSWRLLGAHEQHVGQTLSVFRGGFTQIAARLVADATLQDLRTLVTMAFLNRESSGRYTMQELLRQYTAEKLAQDPAAAQQACDRHCAYYVAALQRWAEDAKGPRQQVALAEMDVTIDNARLAWDWAVERGDIAHMDQAVQGLCLFYHRRIRRPEGEAACRAATERLAALENLAPSQESDNRRVLSKVLTWQSSFLPRKEAAAVAQRSLALLERPEVAAQDVRAEKAAALRQIGHSMMGKDREEARRLYEESLSLYQAVNAAWAQSHVLGSLGFLAWSTGDYKSAQDYHEQSLSIARGLGDTSGIAAAMTGLSGVEMSLGRVEEGARLSRESLALQREMEDPAEIAAGLYSLAFKYITLGRSAEAVPLLEECKTLTSDLGLPGGYVHSVLAWARMLMGHYKQARPIGQTALEMMQNANDPRGIGWAYHVLGGIALGLAEFEEAETLLRDSVAAYRPLGQRQELTFALAYLSCALWAQGRLSEAKENIVEVINIWNAIKSPQSLMFALVGASLISLNQNVPERATELYALASTLSPCLENCAWFWDIAGRHIDVAAASLPPEVIAAAQARGQARDLHATVEELLQVLRV